MSEPGDVVGEKTGGRSRGWGRVEDPKTPPPFPLDPNCIPEWPLPNGKSGGLGAGCGPEVGRLPSACLAWLIPSISRESQVGSTAV